MCKACGTVPAADTANSLVNTPLTAHGAQPKELHGLKRVVPQ